jgi:TonB family protein
MRWTSLLILSLLYTLTAAGQSSSPTAPSLPALPKNPAEIFAAAAPFYDFASSTLKPWHMKVSYQLYDEKSEPTQTGVYEYWWASPDTYRSTWIRGGAEHTDWHVKGEHFYTETGASPQFFEWKLQSDLLTPLPDPEDLDTSHMRYDRETQQVGGLKLPCVMIVPNMPSHGRVQTIPLGEFPTFCFDPNHPVLRAYYSFAGTAVVYNKLSLVQGRYLPRELTIFDGSRRVLTASVDGINGIAQNIPELNPNESAKQAPKLERVSIASGIAQGQLIKQIRPHYPQDAKDARIDGKVVLKALIGRDGHIHELRVLEAPYPSLVAAAMWSVQQWEYKPYLLNGEPVEVDTTINVIFNIR